MLATELYGSGEDDSPECGEFHHVKDVIGRDLAILIV